MKPVSGYTIIKRKGIPLQVCEECGSSVEDTDLHTAWHGRSPDESGQHDVPTVAPDDKHDRSTYKPNRLHGD